MTGTSTLGERTLRWFRSAIAAAVFPGAAVIGGTRPAGGAIAGDPTGAYPIVLSGDFTGDGVEDLFFHSPSPAPDVVYDFDVVLGSGGPEPVYDVAALAAKGSYRPVSGDFTGDDVDDIFWYQPGSGPDVVWDFEASDGTLTYVRRAFIANGTYRPVAGDFTGDGVDDVFFYGPGPVADYLWELDPSSSGLAYRSVPQSVLGHSYRPVAGHFSSVLGGAADIFWYNPSGTESVWDYPANASLAPLKSAPGTLQVKGTTYRLAVADLFDDDYDDVIFVGPGTAPDSIWDFSELGGESAVDKLPAPESLLQPYTVAVGLDSFGEGFEDYFVYNPAIHRGLLYDFFDGGSGEVVYDRQDFEPSPVTP